MCSGVLGVKPKFPLVQDEKISILGIAVRALTVSRVTAGNYRVSWRDYDWCKGVGITRLGLNWRTS